MKRQRTSGEKSDGWRARPSFEQHGHRLVSARLAASPRAAREECQGPLLETDNEEGLLQTPQGLKVWNSEAKVIAL